MNRFDVAVVGGGPAGCAAATVLAQGGARVVLYERSRYSGARTGETLPPDVRVPLERLAAWDSFVDARHQPSPGIVAAWGHPEPHDNDFILNPYGCGWSVDRSRFDAMLASVAQDAGAVVATDFGSRPGFIVDATGRASSFCRSLGATHTVYDRMVALVSHAESAGPDRRALIEATEDGWWYSAGLPDGRLVLAFHTDPGPGLRGRWGEFLAVAPLTGARVGDTAGDDVRIVSANSHRMEPVAGENWIAVGDAGAAHDPLTGLGIHWALESGIAGAEAILSGDVRSYARGTGERFDRYLATRTLYYRAEPRWPDAPFWRRRQGARARGGPGVGR